MKLTENDITLPYTSVCLTDADMLRQISFAQFSLTQFDISSNCNDLKL